MPNVVQSSRRSPMCLSDEEKTSKTEQVSADDEGSRDGEDDQGVDKSPAVSCTPRTKKKVETLKQGLAARRIQRTWKHFYQEVKRTETAKNEQ